MSELFGATGINKQTNLKIIKLHRQKSDTTHSVPECGFEGLKTYQAPAHIWDLPRWWKSFLLTYKIFHMRTCGLSHQIMGHTTVKVAKTGFNWKIVKFTVGPMSKILYINNNDFHNLGHGRSQMCAGAWYNFWPSKLHSGTRCPARVTCQKCLPVFILRHVNAFCTLQQPHNLLKLKWAEHQSWHTVSCLGDNA